jgi:hypothetical protein
MLHLDSSGSAPQSKRALHCRVDEDERGDNDGIDGLGAVQGRGFAQYWLTQVAILGLIVALFVLGDRLRTRRRDRAVAGAAS